LPPRAAGLPDISRQVVTLHWFHLTLPRADVYSLYLLRLEEGVMATIQKWGNSLAVRIPAHLATQIDVHEGSEVEVLAEQGAIVVVPRVKKKFRLADLLRNCKPSQLHGEVDFGSDVGREVLD